MLTEKLMFVLQVQLARYLEPITAGSLAELLLFLLPDNERTFLASIKEN